MLKFYLKEKPSLWLVSKHLGKLMVLVFGLLSFNGYAQVDSVAQTPPAQPVTDPSVTPTTPTPSTPATAAPSTAPTVAQVGDREIKGKVVDKTGEPVIGAVVSVKGTNIGAATDENGAFTIKVPEANANGTLVISYVGYRTVELPLATTTAFDVTIEEDSKLLDEVVVIGYGTQEKEDVTGAIATVKTTDLNRVVVVDAAQALQGRAPGVNVTQNSGTPGAPLTIRVRGVGTLGNSDPLYVVNGVPVTDISYLHANDILSLDVLKDASAAAVYGARAANGVVLVTTKTGANKKPTVDFNYLTGVSKEWKRYNLIDATEWATLRNEADLLSNGKVKYQDPSQFGTGTDWQDQIFRAAIMNSYHLGVSGGSEKTNYYLSGGYLSQQGIIKNSDYDRFTFNSKADHQVTNRLRIGTSLNLATYNRSQLYATDPVNSVIGTALSIDPITKPYSGLGGDSIYASSDGRTDVTNPLGRLENYYNKYKGINFLGNWFGEYELIKGLKLKSSLGFQESNVANDQFTARYFGINDAGKVNNTESNPESIVQRENRIDRTLVWENSISYQKVIAENHKVGGLLLMGMQENRAEQFRARKTNTLNNDPSQRYLNSASGTASVTGDASEWALLSYLARVDYEYKNKYVLTANARIDGSSRFPEDNRWGTFPSFAAGWKISEEGFFEPIKSTISFLKLRASWGKLGNQNIYGGNYPYTTNISSGHGYVFGAGQTSANGYTPLSAGNKNIKWEVVTTSNVALDFAFYRNRLLLTVDYFTKRTSDMLIRPVVPLTSGIDQPPYINAGEILNKGLELSLEYRNEIGRLKYRVGGNLTTIKNEVTKLDDPVYDGDTRRTSAGFVNITKQGGSVAQFYGWETDGLVQTQEEANALQKAQPNVRPGDFKFKDQNGDGVINDKDRVTLGSPLPKFTYGFFGEVSYLGFDLNFFFQGSQGNKIYNGAKWALESGFMNSNMSEKMLDRWTGPGSTNEIPRVSVSDLNNNRRVSNYYIENGSYLRLKAIQLGYTLPTAITQKLKVQKIRIYVAGQNALTFTKYSGLDPEIGVFTPDPNSTTISYLDFGVDKGGTYPQARTWQLGANVTF